MYINNSLLKDKKKDLIDIKNLKSRTSLTLLETYKGKNPYLKKLRNEYRTKNKIKLTENQVKYIHDFHDVEPQLINRVIQINPFLGESLKEKHNLTFVPERILIEFILADQEKTFHVYGKLKRNQAHSEMYWLPKTMVLDDPYFEECDLVVDWDKYIALDVKGRKPYDHQRIGVEFLLCRNGAILADDMGLGKCYQSIVAALEAECKKVLIVCPASVKITWQRELAYFGEESTIISGSRWETTERFTIINFDILKNFHTLGPQKKDKDGNLEPHFRNLVNEKYDLIIIDEAHKVKDHKSIRGKIVNEITLNYGITKSWLLTGTPIANRPMDFYNLLKLTKSPLSENWKFFTTRYCDGKRFYKTLPNGKRQQIWLTKGASNLDELAIRTKNGLLRRLKTEIKDMPDKTITKMHYNLSKRAVRQYEGLWDDYIEKRALDGKRRPSILTRDIVELGLLRKFIAMESIQYTVDLANEAVEQGQKVVIFTTFTDELEELAENFGTQCVVHNGKMSTIEKQKSIDRFQNNKKIKVFIGNIQSAGVGITLTEGTVVIFNSFDWVPGNNEQAEDRCLFGGQEIITSDGYKLIEDIKIGDKVYTHLGNFKKVIGVHNHLERKKCKVDINAFGYNKNISVTEDHKIYVYDNEDKEFKWVEAQNLKIKRHLLTLKEKTINKNGVDRLWLDTYKINNGRAYEIPKEIKLTNELLYAFGFYVADGWCGTDNPNKSSYISICQNINNNKMYDASEYIIKIFKESFNIDKHNSYIDKNNVKTCTVYSKILAENFKKWFGYGVYNKQFPNWVFDLNKNQIESLLNGYYHGDGYSRKNTQQASTVSKKLITQLAILNGSISNPICISNRNSSYSMEYTIKEMVDDVNKIRIKNIDGYVCFPIKNLFISNPKRGEERVYDISVEDDHSFVTGLYNLHNCYRIGQKNNVSVYYQLFNDTISMVMWYTVMRKVDIINQIIGRGGTDADRLKMLLGELESTGLKIE